MNLSRTTEAGQTVISVADSRIDAAVALEFKTAMRQTIDDSDITVILDLSLVQFIDSSGLGAIVAAMKAMGRERTLVLAGLTPAVEKVFRLTRMDTVFPLYSSMEEALGKEAKAG